MAASESIRESRRTGEEAEVVSLYRRLLESWNRRDADGFASLFADDGDMVGFDGSEMTGSTDILAALRQVFADHLTGGAHAGARRRAPARHYRDGATRRRSSTGGRSFSSG